MSEPIWSRHVAWEIAKILGFPMAETAPEGKDQKLCQEGQRLVEDITEQLRYLPGEQTSWAIDYAHFLHAREINETGLRPYGWPVSKLREVREYLLFLRDRHGTALPADESEEWSDEDIQDAANAVFRRLDKEDPYDWEEISKDKEAS